MKEEVGFKNYTYQGMAVSLLDIKEMENKAMILNTDNMIFLQPKPDTRSRFRKFADDWKRRLSHAWDALKGYECD